jgi:gamma-glutamylcyclotransferase (GGCT)/AIG2-like uncharacterized protein YtfP
MDRHGFESAGAPGGVDRLATYGSLAPGRENHRELAGLEGRWFRGWLHGHLLLEGWGAALGYRTLRLAPDACPVDVEVLESAELPARWPALDAFEGPGYRRERATVHTVSGDVSAFIYVLDDPEER